MAGFNDDYYFTGGLDFETSRSGGEPEDRNRSRPQPRETAPVRRDHDFYSDGFDDDLGDYIPGSTVSGVRSPYAQNTAPKRNPDGFDDDIDAGYDALHPIEPRGTRNAAPKYREPVLPVSDDGYYAASTAVDRPFSGQVPSIFAAYFDDGNMPSHRTETRNGRNRVNNYERRRRRRLAVSLLSALAIVLLSSGTAVYFSVFHTAHPLNVSTALFDISGETSRAMIKEAVDSALGRQSYLVSVGGRNSSFQLSSYGFEYAENDAAEDEYIEVTDEEGNVSGQRITTVGSLRFNETLVREFLHNAVGSEGVRMVEPSFDIDYAASAMNVKAGTNGFGVDYDSFIAQIMERIAANSTSPVECTMTETVAPKVDIDEIYSRVHCLAADAAKNVDSTGQTVYTPDVIGVDFDLNAARSQIAAGGTAWSISLVLTQPRISLVELKAPECPDLLASYFTEFKPDNKARSGNLALAARYITENGYLEPGEELSFNDTVGERTPERGFNKATVYSSEGTDEDYGGGICQTSSTLYYTCILANLEIVERHNHMYTVNYMTDTKRARKYGNDATVNWGTADLIIKNSREYPIRIEFVCTTGKIECFIYGTWDGITADLGYDEKGVENYKIKYLPAAPGKKNCAGQQGREVWTYRIVYQNGEIIDRYREAVNKYSPLTEVRYTNAPPAGREYYVLY